MEVRNLNPREHLVDFRRRLFRNISVWNGTIFLTFLVPHSVAIRSSIIARMNPLCWPLCKRLHCVYTGERMMTDAEEVGYSLTL